MLCGVNVEKRGGYGSFQLFILSFIDSGLCLLRSCDGNIDQYGCAFDARKVQAVRVLSEHLLLTKGVEASGTDETGDDDKATSARWGRDAGRISWKIMSGKSARARDRIE